MTTPGDHRGLRSLRSAVTTAAIAALAISSTTLTLGCGSPAPPPKDPATVDVVGDTKATMNDLGDTKSSEDVAKAPPPPPAACKEDDSFGPVQMTLAQFNARRGADAKTFADIPTTKEEPAQACGAAGSYKWLATLTCKDGTLPFADAAQAARSRVGNVGPGGQCKHIVDLYKVPCAEGDYEMFVDMYWCGPEGSFI